MRFIFDQAELNDTARAVLFFNKHARERFADIESLVSYMTSCAHIEIKKPGMVATCGFVLSSFWQPGEIDQTICVRSSVSSSLFR